MPKWLGMGKPELTNGLMWLERIDKTQQEGCRKTVQVLGEKDVN